MRVGAGVRRRVLLAGILLAGAALRLTGVDWDQGQHLHPDERFLTMVATSISAPASIGAYFDTSRSPSNPANVGHPFFVYGTLPLFLTRAVAGLLGAASYERVHLVGRVLSASFDCGTLLVTWLLGRLLGGTRLGLAAAALMALSVPSIQNAHFFTVDAAASFFAAAGLYALLRVARGGGARDHLLFGVSFGLALACRVNLVLVAPIYAFAAARPLWHRRRSARETLGAGALAVAVAALLFRTAQPYAFAGPGFLDVTPCAQFVASLRTIGDMVAGNVHFPPALQWIGRVPFLYAGRNVFLWNMGPAWGLASLAGIAWLLTRGRAAATTEREGRALGRIALLWTAVLFLFHASQFAATARYFLPLLPGFAVLAAWPLVSGGRARTASLVFVVAATGAWALAFSAIYRGEHTRVHASRWIYEHVPPGSRLLVEDWDDALPLRVEGQGPERYERITLRVYDEDSVSKRNDIVRALDAADYVVLSSRRAYGSVPRNPWRYPVARRYYELLLAEQLGFRRQRVFTSYPALGPFEIPDDGAEEAFSVYDHPTVIVYARTADFSRERAAALLDAVPLDRVRPLTPREASSLYRVEWPAALSAVEPVRRPPTMGRPSSSLAAATRWLLGLELSSLAAFGMLFPLLGGARDRGYALSKTVGWLAPGYVVFSWCSLGLAPITPATVRLAAVLFVTAGAAVAWRHRGPLAAFARERRGEWVLAQAVFSSAFVLFALLRAANPAIFWGEKPMDFALLNALYRTPALPPGDPWMAGAPLRYSYFGHWLVAALGRLTGVEPALAFNLGIATAGALLASGAYATGRQLGGRCAGLLGATGTVLLGNLSAMRLAAAAPGRTFDFDFFWATSRVIPGTINEYPFWSLIFGDLHAHLLALPFDVAAMFVAALWLTGSLRRRPAVGLGLLAAWLAGASVASNAWNLPVAMAVPPAFLATAWLGGGRTRGELSAAVGLAAVTWLLGIVLFLPFRAVYDGAGGLARGWESRAAGVADVCTVFGLLLVAVLPGLVPAWRSRWPPGARAAVAGALGVLALAAVAWVRSPTTALYLGVLVLAAGAWLGERRRSVRAAALLAALAAGIGLLTETFFVSDRMNTVFKYSLHVWLLLALAAGILVPRLISDAPRAQRPLRRDLVAVGMVCGLFTSVAAAMGLLRDPRMRSPGPTLDGLRYLRESRPDEEEAYRWLRTEVHGSPVLLEAQGPPYGPYARVSMNTGLPTVLGWEHHLRQRGHSAEEVEARRRDVRALFDTADAESARALLQRHGVDLVFVGPLERETYSREGLAKFGTWTTTEVVFRNRDVRIYARPGTLESTRAWSDAQ